MRSPVFAVIAAGLVAAGAAGCGGGHHHTDRHRARTASTPARTSTTIAPATPAPAAGVSITGSAPSTQRASAVAYITAGHGPAGVRLNGRRMSVAGDKGATASLVSPTGQLVAIASAGTGGATLQLDRRDGSAYLTMPSSVSSVVPLAWSPDARYLALALHDGPAGGTFEVLDTRTGALTLKQSGRTERASFAPGKTDVVFFDLDHSHLAGYPSPDIWSAVVGPGPGDNSGAGPITHDGMSANPVRIRAGIVYDAIEDLPGHSHLVYVVAIWGHTTIHPVNDYPAAVGKAGGLVTVAVSGDGRQLLATSRLRGGVYVIDSVTRKVRTVSTASGIVPVGISRDGRQLLVTVGAGSHRSAATLPTAGGTPHVIASGATAPSWNR